MVNVDLGESLKVKFCYILNPELHTDLLQQHILFFVQECPHQRFDLVVLYDLILFGYFELLFSKVINDSIGINIIHSFCLLHAILEALDLWIIFVDLGGDHRVESCALVDIFSLLAV